MKKKNNHHDGIANYLFYEQSLRPPVHPVHHCYTNFLQRNNTNVKPYIDTEN